MGFCQIRGPLKSFGWLVPELVEWPADWQARNEKMDYAYPIPWLTSTRPGKSMSLVWEKRSYTYKRFSGDGCMESLVSQALVVFLLHISQFEISSPTHRINAADLVASIVWRACCRAARTTWRHFALKVWEFGSFHNLFSTPHPGRTFSSSGVMKMK